MSTVIVRTDNIPIDVPTDSIVVVQNLGADNLLFGDSPGFTPDTAVGTILVGQAQSFLTPHWMRCLSSTTVVLSSSQRAASHAVIDEALSPVEIDSTGVADSNVLVFNAASGLLKPGAGGGGSGGGGAPTIQGVSGTALGSAQTVDFSSVAKEIWLVGLLNSNVTVTFANRVAGSRALLLLTQDGTGSRTLTVSDGTNNLAVPITSTAGAVSDVVVDCPDATAVNVVSSSGGGGAVSSVFARTGAVTATLGDYTAAQVTNAADKSSGSQQAFSGELKAPDFTPAGLTGAVAASRYVGATTAGAPVSGTFAKGDWITDQLGKRWTCTTAGTPGTWSQEPGLSGGLAPSAQIFTASGTYTIPAGATLLEVVAVGGGGGGGGGGSIATAAAQGGGAGGGAGAVGVQTVSVGTDTSLTVTVGTGGSAGTGAVANGAAGTAGGNGAITTVTSVGGTSVSGTGGVGGSRGTASSNATIGGGMPGAASSSAVGAISVAPSLGQGGTNGAGFQTLATGGAQTGHMSGGGGGGSSSNTTNGGLGGNAGSKNAGGVWGGAAGNSGTASGGDGAAAVANSGGGGGGGGGGTAGTGTGGNGGAGGSGRVVVKVVG